MSWRFCIFFLIPFVFGCNISSSNCDWSNYSPANGEGVVELLDTLDTRFTSKIFERHKFNPNITYCLSNDTSTTYLNYISIDGFYVRIDLMDSTRTQISPVRFLTGNLTDMSISSDSILILDFEAKKFYILKNSSPTGYKVSKEIDLSTSVISSNNYIRYSLSASQFLFKSPILYFVVGDKNGRNLLGKHSIVYYNSKTSESKYLAPYPACFSKKDIYDENTHFGMLSPEKILVSYNNIDAVQCFDSKNKVTFEVVPSHSEPFIEYDKKNDLNPAYIRKFENTRDENLGVVCLDSSRFLIFKRASTTNVTQTAKYYCNYFKNEGKSRVELELPPIIVRNIIAFRNGFLSLSPDMKSARLYGCR